MEQIIPELLFDDIEPVEVKFLASYDPDTGELLCVGPDHAFTDDSPTIEIDDEIAEMIIKGKLSMISCIVNLASFELETILDKKSTSINNILYKIPVKDKVDASKIDLHCLYYQKSKTLKVILSKDYQKPNLIKKYQLLDGNAKLQLIISDYCDPNNVYQIVTIPFKQLIDGNKVVKNLNFSKNMSMYTKKIFMNYAVEIK